MPNDRPSIAFLPPLQFVVLNYNKQHVESKRSYFNTPPPKTNKIQPKQWPWQSLARKSKWEIVSQSSKRRCNYPWTSGSATCQGQQHRVRTMSGNCQGSMSDAVQQRSCQPRVECPTEGCKVGSWMAWRGWYLASKKHVKNTDWNNLRLLVVFMKRHIKKWSVRESPRIQSDEIVWFPKELVLEASQWRTRCTTPSAFRLSNFWDKLSKID